MTTIVLVRKNKDVVVASDGQVSMGNTVIKSTANKVNASAVDPANPAITFLFSIFLTLLAVLLIIVLPMLTCPSLATITSLFFLTSTIVVMVYKWILN